ncbi:A-kinase anchor protein 17B isoform X3 [Chelonia mydas]|uniref:A-kinase anchor protein 17B isoform X3 n=1 Tax=Chelonia mydas TaxID=8469 RepID=UPI0018A1E653|nr:A-kinase anchor protein 17B isoform X3 [Chelonia mydas]
MTHSVSDSLLSLPIGCCLWVLDTMTITVVYDNSEAMELCASQHLYLKPVAKLTINVVFPEHTESTRSFSKWEVMDKLKNMICPDQFTTVRVSKSTKDFIRFEGEAETKRLILTLKEKLHGKVIKLNGFKDDLKVMATEAHTDFPAPQEWASYLNKREITNEDLTEQTADIPDCIYFEGLPCKWFALKGSNNEKPSEDVLRVVFESFGKIKNIDIPMLDPYREEMVGGNLNNFLFGGLQTFEAFIQYQEYTAFVKAMESLRGMKLMFKGDDGKALACNMKVTFDTTKHFSKGAIKKRRLERQKLQELEQERKREKKKEEEEAARKRRDDEKNARERKRKAKLKRREHRQIDRDEKRPRKQQKVTAEEEQWPENMPEWEERKYLLAQRRVESIRLLTVLLSRVKDFAQLTGQKVEPLLHPEDIRKDCFPETELQNADRAEQRESHYHLHKKLKDKKKFRSQFFQTVNTSFSEEEVPTNLPASPCHLVRTILNDPTATASTGKLTGRDDYSSSDGGTLQITVTQDCKVIESLEREDFPPLKTLHSGTVSDTGYCKKQKIYETDEFIHYLLNYYQTPSYARVCLEPKSTVSKSWWQRIVSDNGNGFQINLKNKYGQRFTEVSFVQNLDKGNCSGDDNYRWEITIRKSEPTESVSKNKAYAGGFTKKFQVQWNDSLDIANLPYAEFKNSSFGSTNTSHDKESKQDNNRRVVAPPYKPSGSAYKLKDLMEEISSDSEYFSEAKRTERRYKDVYSDGNKACSLPREMERKFLVCVKNVGQNYSENESSKCSFCSNSTHGGLTKQCRHKLKKSFKRCSSKLRHEGQKSEWKSNEEVINTHKKKKKRKKLSPNILPDEHGFSEMDSWRQLESLKKIQRKCSKMFHHKMKFKTLHVMAAASSKDAIHTDASLLQRSRQRAGDERKLTLRKEMDADVGGCLVSC